MKGYRKIAEGDIECSKQFRESDDNYEMDCQIRSVVHSAIISEGEKTDCTQFRVVVYKQKRTKGGEHR